MSAPPGPKVEKVFCGAFFQKSDRLLALPDYPPAAVFSCRAAKFGAVWRWKHIQESDRKIAKPGIKMENSKLVAETPSLDPFPEQVDDGHRLSHVPFYFVVAIVGLCSMLALLYRIAGS